MPPGGLYSLARHHLYDGHRKRPMFNAKELESAEVANGVEDKASATEEGATEEGATAAGDVEREEKRHKKKSKKHRRSGGEPDTSATEKVGKRTSEIQPTNGAGSPPTRNIASYDDSDTKAKRSKKDRKRPEADIASKSSAKKRKRESEVRIDAPAEGLAYRKTGTSSSSTIGKDIVQNVKAALAGMGSQPADKVPEPEKQKKTKKKSKPEKLAKNTDLTAINSLLTPEERVQLLPGSQLQNSFVRGSPVKKQKTRKSDNNGGGTKETVTQNGSWPPKKSAVPLPPPSSSSSFSAMRTFYQDKAKEAINNEEVLVPETPPSNEKQLAYSFPKTPVPFPSLRSDKPAAIAPKPTGTQHLAKAIPSSSLLGAIEPSASAPPVLQQYGSANSKSNKSNKSTNLTPAATRRITQPLTDEPKPKPSGRAPSRASSVTSLTSSRASSISIPEMFNRVGMPYARSGVGVDPSATPQAKKVKHRETHKEASLSDFNQRFHGLQQSVNFANEQEYLNQYLDWHEDNETEHAVPCLGSATGCTPKKEEILRLSKEEDVNIIKAMQANGGDANALQNAKERALKAEEFLMLAIRARVPVPVNRLDGTWTLYCPKYSEHHFDRYGYGMRTLSISSIAGFKDPNAYTARLSIPPRSMCYSIRMFSAPPHASLRTTVIQTIAEEYKMEVIFLGNGYLKLRVDLNLLLRGKPTEMVGGKKVMMEFVGVHEKALEWAERKDELEEEGKKLFSKYGAVDDK